MSAKAKGKQLDTSEWNRDSESPPADEWSLPAPGPPVSSMQGGAGPSSAAMRGAAGVSRGTTEPGWTNYQGSGPGFETSGQRSTPPRTKPPPAAAPSYPRQPNGLPLGVTQLPDGNYQVPGNRQNFTVTPGSVQEALLFNRNISKELINPPPKSKSKSTNVSWTSVMAKAKAKPFITVLKDVVVEGKIPLDPKQIEHIRGIVKDLKWDGNSLAMTRVLFESDRAVLETELVPTARFWEKWWAGRQTRK